MFVDMRIKDENSEFFLKKGKTYNDYDNKTDSGIDDDFNMTMSTAEQRKKSRATSKNESGVDVSREDYPPLYDKMSKYFPADFPQDLKEEMCDIYSDLVIIKGTEWWSSSEYNSVLHTYQRLVKNLKRGNKIDKEAVSVIGDHLKDSCKRYVNKKGKDGAYDRKQRNRKDKIDLTYNRIPKVLEHLNEYINGEDDGIQQLESVGNKNLGVGSSDMFKAQINNDINNIIENENQENSREVFFKPFNCVKEPDDDLKDWTAEYLFTHDLKNDDVKDIMKVKEKLIKQSEHFGCSIVQCLKNKSTGGSDLQKRLQGFIRNNMYMVIAHLARGGYNKCKSNIKKIQISGDPHLGNCKLTMMELAECPKSEPQIEYMSYIAKKLNAWVIQRLGVRLEENDEVALSNVLTKTIADHFKMGDVVPGAGIGKMSIDGKLTYGSYLESAKGGNSDDIDPNDNKRFKYSPEAIKQAVNLWILDYICGQFDRHGNNVMFNVDDREETIKQIQGIDHDMAFGNKDKDMAQSKWLLGIDKIKWIDSEICKAILNFKWANLEDNLTKDVNKAKPGYVAMFGEERAKEIINRYKKRFEYVEKRIENLQAIIRNGFGNNTLKTMETDADWAGISEAGKGEKKMYTNIFKFPVSRITNWDNNPNKNNIINTNTNI